MPADLFVGEQVMSERKYLSQVTRVCTNESDEER